MKNKREKIPPGYFGEGGFFNFRTSLITYFFKSITTPPVHFVINRDLPW